MSLKDLTNIDHNLFNESLDWFEANDKKIQLSNIQKVLDREEGKRGRKTAEYSVIKSLQDRDMTDIAIYVGMALTKVKLKPKWTVDDVVNLLDSKNFISNKLVPMLSKEYLKDADVTIPQMKTIAIQIQENVIKNEKETIDYVRNSIKTTKKDKNSILAHQLTRQQLTNLRNCIVIALRILKESTEDFKAEDYLNHIVSDDNLQTTYTFMNKLMGGNFKASSRSLLNEITVVLNSLIDVKDSGEVKNMAGKKKLTKWIKDLNKIKKVFDRTIEKTIIWPETEKSIDSEKSLLRYFKQLEIDREKAQKIIARYKKLKAKQTHVSTGDKAKDEENASSEWSDEKVNKVVNTLAKELSRDKQFSLREPDEIVSESDKIAQELVDSFPGLQKFLEKDHPDYIGELSSIIASRLQSKNLNMGRPIKDENK